MSPDTSRHRLGLLAVMALSLFGALFARLWFLQVVEASDLQAQVTSNATRTVTIPAERGRILDANNRVLVDNRNSVVVSIDWQQYRDLAEREQQGLLDRLSTVLSRDKAVNEVVSVEFLERRLADDRFNRFRPVPVAEDITVEEEIYFSEQAERFPSVVVENLTVREYKYGSLAAHVLGYVGPLNEAQWEALEEDNHPDKPYERTDDIGKAGVEATYETYLRGTPGQRVYEVDRRNRVVREVEDQRIDPVQGDDVHLSIDARLQYKTEEALQARIVASGTPTPAGSAVVTDPQTGQIRAMASYPTYNPADLVGGISQDLWAELTDPETKALQNRAIQEGYAAASTFKLASSYAGLKMDLITPYGTVMDNGVYSLCEGNGPGCKKANSGGGAPMGPIDLAVALTRSSDYYYYVLGHEAWLRHTRDDAAPEDGLQQHMKELGYGARTGIDLAAETGGRIPTPESNRELADALWERSRDNYDNDEKRWQEERRWKAGWSADISIGQWDVLVTPLQTAMAYTALVNPDGNLFQPSVLSHIARANSATVVQEYEPTVTRTIDWMGSRDAFLQGFDGVVTSSYGTAHATFADFPLDQWGVAGKTGTAEVGDKQDGRRDNSLFVGWGPTNGEPRYLASVLIEGGGFGAQSAAPAVRMIFEPLATGEITDGDGGSFRMPSDGSINAERAAETSSSIGTSAAD